MVIRPMELSDVSEVAKVYIATVQNAYRHLVAAHLLPADSAERDLEKFYSSFVWHESPILVADIWAWVCWFCRTKDRPKKSCEIAQLYVNPNMQWRWVWKKLISHIEQMNRYRDLRLLVIEWNRSAINFYTKVWFIPTGQRKFLPQFQVHELEFGRSIKDDKNIKSL